MVLENLADEGSLSFFDVGEIRLNVTPESLC